MSKIKSLSSGLTAIALVAGIGLAYAQSTTDPNTQPPSTTGDTTLRTPAPATAPADRVAPNAAGQGPAGISQQDGSLSSTIDEPAPQADRG